MLRATLYTDAACPWGYSAIPALRVLDWRYGDQIEWRLVMIGLAESAQVYIDRGYTPLGFAVGWQSFRRYGMPFDLAPKARVAATARACRAVVAARLDQPGEEWRVLRTLQLANFTSSVLLDDDAQLQEVLAAFRGIVTRLDDRDVTAAYERDRAEARTAVGTPAELQGKTADYDGVVRYTAPSVVFERDGRTLVAGGFQPVEAYDVLVANLDPTLRREHAPESPLPLLERFPDGLTTQEVAALLARGNDAPDRRAAEEQLLALIADGAVTREPLGDDALWLPAASALRVAA